MDLEKGFHNLDHPIPQAEGVTLDDERNLYIVSEPNLLYRFKPAR
ncbi:MAG: SdiA-regulated domain-containing protein [Verrucomicrobiota bacterium]